MSGVTIAIRDDAGVLRRVTKILPMTDGIAISVPYHSAKEGWLFEHPMHYERTEGFVPVSEMTHYTADDRVKLSVHLGGFVQFSRAGKQPILSGFDPIAGRPKGIGLKASEPISVTSGPLFSILVRNLEEFEELGDRQAVVFEQEDLWYHPRLSSAPAKAFHLEGFMFPRQRLIEVRNIDGKRILRTELPFISLIRFRHDLRVVEFENLPIFIGLILHRMSVDGTGFTLAGPAYAPPGEPFKGISAWYPRPDLEVDGKSFLVDAKSLNFQTSKSMSLDATPSNDE